MSDVPVCAEGGHRFAGESWDAPCESCGVDRHDAFVSGLRHRIAELEKQMTEMAEARERASLALEMDRILIQRRFTLKERYVGRLQADLAAANEERSRLRGLLRRGQKLTQWSSSGDILSWSNAIDRELGEEGR